MSKVKFSEVRKQEMESAKIIGKDEHGRIHITYSSDHGGKSETLISPRGRTPEKVLENLIAEKKRSMEDYLIVESFEGLSIEEIMNHPKYSHARSRSYGITFYARVSDGVNACGGCSNEELNQVTGCLSPTEGLRRF